MRFRSTTSTLGSDLEIAELGSLVLDGSPDAAVGWVRLARHHDEISMTVKELPPVARGSPDDLNPPLHARHAPSRDGGSQTVSGDRGRAPTALAALSLSVDSRWCESHSYCHYERRIGWKSLHDSAPP